LEERADILARILYLVEDMKLSIDVAFKRVCKGRLCAAGLEDRERIYNLARDFISNVIRLRCLYGNKSRKKLARIFLAGGPGNEGAGHLDPWCLYSVPEWLYREVEALLGGEAEDLFSSMGKRVWWLRLNTVKASEEKIVRMLEEEAVVERDRDLWYLYRIIESRKPVRMLKAVKQRHAIPQDKASCMVVEALKPQPGDLILDMAAAPGIKTSLIVMISEGRARVVAADISKRRSMAMKRLLRELGALGSVDIVIADSRLPPHGKAFDKILLDAPCTSSGSISKDPAVRLHLSRRGRVEYYSKIQRAMLEKAAGLAPEIVYSTCSILPEEGEEVVESLVDILKPVDPGINARRGYSRYMVSSLAARMFPHTHMSEGFFIAKLYSLKLHLGQ